MSKESLTDTIQQVQRLHHAKREAVGDVVNTNYSGDESHNIRLTSMGINKAFTDLLVEANRISGGFFGDHFTIDGLPITSPDDIRTTLQEYDLNGDLSRFVESVSMPQDTAPGGIVSPLYRRFIMMNGADGRASLCDPSAVSLRGGHYYSADPDTNRLIKESGSITVGIDADSRILNEAALAAAATKQDTEPANSSEKVILASPLDHVKNIGLMYLNCAQLLVHSINNIETITSGIESPPRYPKTEEIYKSIVEDWLSDSQAIKNIVQQLDDGGIQQSIKNIVGAYHLFLLDGDKTRLEIKETDINQLESLIGHIANAVKDFEEKVAVNTGINSKMKTRAKRELFKRILRSERDADHPGINLLHVSQFIETEPDPEGTLILGTTYGGIEYPFIYDTLRAEADVIGSCNTNTRGSVIFSLYNLQYSPSTAALAKKHVFPSGLLDHQTPKKILVFDDNAVSGKTGLHIRNSLHYQYPNARIEIACSDINTLPEDLEQYNSLRTGILTLASSGTRRFLNTKPRKQKTGSPSILSPSRYAMPHKPRRPETKA